MKYLPATSPLTKRFERCPRMALDQAVLLAADAPGRFHGNRGVRSHGRPRGGKRSESRRPARRLAPVFGVRLECRSPDGNMASVEVAAAYGPGKKSIPSPLLEEAAFFLPTACPAIYGFRQRRVDLL